MARILVADDEAGIREFVSEALEVDGHVVDTCGDGWSAEAAAGKASYDVVITDLKMPNGDGMTLLRTLRSEQPEIEVIMLTAHGSVDSAVEAMKLGAFDYVRKPVENLAEIRLLVSRAVEHKRLKAFREDTVRPHKSLRLSYGAPSMDVVERSIDKVAKTAATVLLVGESGTGKELAARAIHERSPRVDGPFSAVNCAALTETLLESELFGHEKGAFTGAESRRLGRVELAAGGTFFLDEVGELKLELQAKLLRVLQERTFHRVGGGQTITADVRWVAATNRDLCGMIATGEFREDLYHRLAVFPIQLPPLRERQADFESLVPVLLQQIGAEIGRQSLSVSTQFMQTLKQRRFPGNIRELRNVLERAAILCEGTVIDAFIGFAAADVVAGSASSIKTLYDVEKRAIEEALSHHQGNRKRAAEALGIGVRTLYDKLKRYRLE